MSNHLDEVPAARQGVRLGAALALERFVSSFPGADRAVSRRLMDALFRLVDEGILRPDLVEMSLAFGEDDFRIVANGGASIEPANRIAVTGRVLDAFDLSLPTISRVVSSWLISPSREVFVGAAVGTRDVRSKLYLRDASGAISALEQAAAELGMRGSGQGRSHFLICVDFVCQAPIAVKRYEHIDWATARHIDPEGRLGPFLLRHHGEPEGLPFHRTVRSTPTGEVIDIQVNAQLGRTVVGPAWDIAYAEYVGDASAVGILRRARDAGPVVVRHVGETLDRETGRHVYLAIPE